MKKFLFGMAALMMVAILSVGIASCSKDDNNGGGVVNPANPLVGTWRQLKSDGVTFSSDVYTFYANGIATKGDWRDETNKIEIEDTYKYYVENGKIFLDEKEDDGTYHGKWKSRDYSINGNILTLGGKQYKKIG